MAAYVYQSRDEELGSLAAVLETRDGNRSGRLEAPNFDMVQMLLDLNRDGRLLDIGSGHGRVVQLAQERIAHTVALEPDVYRWKSCFDAYSDPPRVHVLNQTTTDYIKENPGEKFDVVVLGHVIQPVSVELCQNILQDVSALLSDKGAAVIFTTHASEDCRGFSYSKAGPDETYSSQETFDRYAEDSESQDKGLPVRQFSKREFLEVLSESLDPVYRRPVSFLRESYLPHRAAQLGTTPDELRDVATSQFAVARTKRSDEPGRSSTTNAMA